MCSDYSESALSKVILPQEPNRNQRLDRFLSESFPERSRSQIQKWIEDQNVLVDGKPAKSGYRIRGKEHVEVQLPGARPSTCQPEAIPLEIIYEDKDLAVINKPAGMVVHSGAGANQGTLVNALLHHFGELSKSGGPHRPGIVHRLDKQTSGLLVVAKNDLSHLSLSRQFQSRKVTKQYIALVHGEFETNGGEIKAPIGRDRIHRTRMTTRTSRAREAHTTFQVKDRFPKFTLLELSIKTGRTHQIRVHLSSIRHPVVGDTLYGAPGRIRLPGTQTLVPTLSRNFLHAAHLEFSHPRTEALVKFYCPLPPALGQFLERLRNP
jgi:23S rRNA pseudouridine1911/1915/1917 synthase